MLFAEVVATSEAVAATSSRTAKRDALAGLLERADPNEVEAVVGYLVGEPRQGRFGVGWRTLAAAEQAPAPVATVTVTEVDQALTRLAGLAGPGSAAARRAELAHLLGRATAAEAAFLARLVAGELRQGALGGVMTDAVARAAGVPATVVRRAVMLGGRLDVIARLALTGGRDALTGVGLEVGRPLQPMLASTATSVADAVAAVGRASVEWKLDGIRIQVHRDGDDIRVWTRNLNEITERVPEVVAATRSLGATRLVLDGEAISIGPDGRPRLFQDTVSWRDRPTGAGGADHGEADEADPAEAGGDVDADAGDPGRRGNGGDRGIEPDSAGGDPAGDDDRPGGEGLQPFFFDLLHADGRDLLDEPLAARLSMLGDLTGDRRIPGTVTEDPDIAAGVLDAALAAGHEGVVVKALGTAYEAGRRGKAWRKVKPVHTFDLVVLAAEWGHGRRRGWLSNLHLGARADDDAGFVMVGKTFKGLTDDLLRWQTDRLLALAEREERWDGPETGVVLVRPEQVVEVAIDGVQRSTRYPGGLALRFARVVRYRPDKDAADADPLAALRARGPDTA